MTFRERLIGTLRQLQPVLEEPGVLVVGSEVPNLLQPDAAAVTGAFGEACLSLFPLPIFLTNPANRQLMVIQKITVEADVRFLKLLPALNRFL